MEYRKKPVIVNAWQYDGDLQNSDGEFYCPPWVEKAFSEGTLYYDALDGSPSELFVKTLEGDHHASVGDYIIKGVAGELYPCKSEIFNQTYELAYLDDDDVPAEALANDTVPEKVKVKADTIIRTIVLALALINQIIVACGYNPLPIEDAMVYELGSLLLTLGASLWAWWKNNSFTKKAIKADEELRDK